MVGAGRPLAPGGTNEWPDVPFQAPSHWIGGGAATGSGTLLDAVNPADDSVVASLAQGLT
ncbi:hypothetical protein ABZZ36_38660 [Actinacidiphila glaucinigra]|uniref:hypothetical protein n=1 Tax=Actinacidiphila glaucinigra TaxID=235986 RepID=UPI0033A8B723